MKSFVSLLMIAPLVTGCGAVGRLSNVGKAPTFTPVADVQTAVVERSLARPDIVDPLDPRAPVGQPQPLAASASLFRAGAGGLFRDQRASATGDIVTIRIDVRDRASVDNTTSRSRSSNENAGIASLLGLERPLSKLLPGNPDTSSLVDAGSTSKTSGAGSTERSETINMTMAAVVTDVLPNGNLVIRGRQEMRVNFELRELIVSGIIRPQDIARDNSIRHSQIAEARISYGGRGQLTDVQQARWAQQIYDALFPF
ncbi:flagellar basal body L-ring protein FlgH [Novosphingobium sp. M1R2S20]|uniref:Flagellar L-ring protein n=1 Tax=Novosphingobium rhizovicinum TaxID=3228928 RepID=A0ABV3R9D3_9SPHN